MAKLWTIALAAALTLGACGDAPTSDASRDSEPPVAIPAIDSNDESTTTSEAVEGTISTNAAGAPQIPTITESAEPSVAFLETVFGPWELSPDLERAVRKAFVDSDHALTSDTIFVSLRGTPQLADTGSTAAFSAWADAEGGAVLAEFVQTTQPGLADVELINVGQLDGKCSLNTLTPLPSFFECDLS